MKGKKLILTFCVLYSLLNIKLSSGFIANFQTYVTFATNFADKANHRFNDVIGNENEKEEYGANAFGDRTGAYLEALIGKADKLSTALNVISTKMEKKLKVLETMLRDMPDLVNRQAMMNEFARNSDRITMAYKTLQLYTYKEEDISESRIKTFISDNVASQQKAGLEGILGDIASIIISPVNPDNLLTVMERMEGVR